MLSRHGAEDCPHLAIQVRDAVHRVPPLILFLFLRLLHLLLFLPINNRRSSYISTYGTVYCVYIVFRPLTFL
jgi:energy-coupling factor transporter transmembrane protein EcfT